MFRRSILALSVAALAFAGMAHAQQNATLVLRSGDRVTGQLLDLGGMGFTIKVDGVDKQVPMSDVAVIDFAGFPMTDADWARIPDGQQVVWLRDGQTIIGQLYDIDGSSPLKITFRTAGGDRQLSSAEIDRIVLARLKNAVGTTGPVARAQVPPAAGPGISVSSRQRWTATGITVRKGDRLTFTTTGEVQLSADPNDTAVAGGSRSRRYADGAPLMRMPVGVLIGQIGNGAAFGIANLTSIVAPDAGQLFLGINDDELNDNQGEFRVQIVNGGGGRR